MTKRPDVKPRDWITIDAQPVVIDAIVCSVSSTAEDVVEAVYLDYRDRAINEDIRWTGESWEFLHSGAHGGYADKYDRLREHVGLLRRGRPAG